jgi:hypothetical protein
VAFFDGSSGSETQQLVPSTAFSSGVSSKKVIIDPAPIAASRKHDSNKNNNYQLSSINYQLSSINYQLSIINYQLSIIKYQLSILLHYFTIASTVAITQYVLHYATDQLALPAAYMKFKKSSVILVT